MSQKTAAVVEDTSTAGGVIALSGVSALATSDIEGRSQPDESVTRQFSLFSQNTFHLCCVIALWTILAIYYSFVFFVTRKSPFSLDYEGHVLWACDKLAHFQNIYAPEFLSQQPFAVTMYNPLFMAFGALCNQITGHNLSSIRSISVLSTILCFIGIYRILHKRCRTGVLHAAAVTGLFASYLSVFYWSHLARVDMLGLAFAVWGVERFAVAIGDAEKRNVRSEVLALTVSILLFVCAFFTKQQYFIFPVAAAVFCLAERRMKLGVIILSTFLGAAVAIGGLLELVTGGYLAHLTYARGLHWEWETLSVSLIPFLSDSKTVAISVILIASLFVRAASTRLDKLAVIIIAIAVPLALYTMGLRGAFHNHLLTIEFAMCLLVASRLPRFSPSITTLVLVLALLATSGVCRSASDFAWRLMITDKNKAALGILKQLAVKGKRVLFEDASVALALGAEPDFVDVTTLFNTTGSAAQKVQAVCSSIEKKEYAAIMINSRDNLYDEIIWPKRVVRAIKKDYKKLDCTFCANGERQRVYVPR